MICRPFWDFSSQSGIMKWYGVDKSFCVVLTKNLIALLFQITEMLDVLLTYVESKHCRDQFFLLILEPRCIEILYALLLEKIFTTELREKVLKVCFATTPFFLRVQCANGCFAVMTLFSLWFTSWNQIVCTKRAKHVSICTTLDSKGFFVLCKDKLPV